eukprot:TRINITY_DN34_c0_g1_i1.p1 TRINITY_DN34_c0_g1~~TRINITY_DN34_c0_g1_i1.p1  ORF type:complete len:221 (-),score=75.55 TRINITY_DN34_c0_g1_i1:68-730(-)
MVRHNNVLPNSHFHKDWQIRVKTWFNQPARKERRRRSRVEKAKKNFPRPVEGLLRPVVRGQTLKYNRKTKYGRGFTLAELKEAKINKREALSIGISVDYRRKNRSERSLKENVQRLKNYKSRLVVFPRRSRKATKKGGDKAKTAPAVAAEVSKATQLTGEILPITKPTRKVVRANVAEILGKSKQTVYQQLRHARADARLIGIRKKRTEEKAAKAEAAKK